VYRNAVGLQHDEAVRPDCHEQSKGFDLPCVVHAVNRYVGETSKSVPQGVSGGTGGTQYNDFSGHCRQRSGKRGARNV
jgi:hypothetical protein